MTAGTGGHKWEIREIGENAKGRGNTGVAPWAPRGKNAEGPSKKLGSSLDCGLTVHQIQATMHEHVSNYNAK